MITFETPELTQTAGDYHITAARQVNVVVDIGGMTAASGEGRAGNPVGLDALIRTELVGPELRSGVQDHGVAQAVVDLEVVDEDKRVAAGAAEDQSVVTAVGLAVRKVHRSGWGNHRDVP
jgi:hypothetical protein